MKRLALFLIGSATPASDREWVLGDTTEELQRIEQSSGRDAARRWLLRETFRVLAGRGVTVSPCAPDAVT